MSLYFINAQHVAHRDLKPENFLMANKKDVMDWEGAEQGRKEEKQEIKKKEQEVTNE
jgi:hypothetical protein